MLTQHTISRTRRSWTNRTWRVLPEQCKKWATTSILLIALILLFVGVPANETLATPLSPSSRSTLTSLKMGTKGETVQTLQRQLVNLDYLQIPITGVYDDATQAAVRQFQADQDLPADGVAGAQTQQLLTDAQNLIDPLRPEMPPDIQRILNRGKLIVAVLGTDNPPFFMDESNSQSHTLVGLDINIAEGLAESLGVDVEFNRAATTFNEVVDQVYQLKADIAISKLSRTLSRAQRVRFSRPYVSMRQGFIANRLQLAQQTQDSGMIQAIRNFQGKVGVIKSSSYVGFLTEKFPNATIVEYASWNEIVDAVINGDVQAAYRDELEVKKIIRQNPDAALRLQTIALTDTKDQIAMALPWDSSHLQVFVNQYLDTLELNYNADLVLDEYEDYLEKT